jgi:hypothetical protein
MRTVPFGRGVAIGLVLIGLSGGCGDGKVRLRGTVTYEGKPVERGIITFDPADGQGPNTGGEIVQGTYHLTTNTGVLPGKKIVRIRAFRATGRRIEAGPPAPPGTLVDEIEAYIPARYNDQSTLTVEIIAGKENEIDFNLPVKEPAP